MSADDRLLMSPVAVRFQRLKADERGFSLVELMVVILVLGVMMGAILGSLEATHRAAPQDQERADVIRDTQSGLNRMTRELRHAYKVTSAGKWSITAAIYKNGGTTTVTYDCTSVDPSNSAYRICNRSSTGGSGSTSNAPVITRVLLVQPAGGGQPPDVFTYDTNSAGHINYVGVTVVTSAQGDRKQGYTHKVTLSDGFFLRNVDSCGSQAATACP